MRVNKIAVAVLLLGLSACGSPSNSATSTSEGSSSTPKPLVHPLSGRDVSPSAVLAVKIDDTEPAHPQIGLASADVVYVEQVEGGLTRLAAIFSSEIPTQIGPVRSARISDIDILAPYGRVAFAYSGAQRKLLPVIADANVVNLGAQRESPKIYYRDETRNAPTNLILDPIALLAKAEGVTTAQSVGWHFGPLPAGGETLTSVEMHWPASWYLATWSNAEKRWMLSHDGDADLDSLGGQLGPSTLVVQMVDIHPSVYGDKFGGNTPQSETVGRGDALVLRDGRVFKTTWSRPDMASGTTFSLPDGKEMLFAPGQVWIWLADRTKSPQLLPDRTPAAAPASSSTPKSAAPSASPSK
ncbi:MAG: DUF3048 domain-containing protein [Actinomycetes bacterium]